MRLRDLRSVPVLPSIITLGNLFLGFLAMAKAADAVRIGGIENPLAVQHFETATLCIFFAMVFDALDGRVARMTGQTSAFGAQLDSLADVVTFGCAPAFVALQLVKLHEGPPIDLLPPHPKLYHFCAAVYVVCAAMRLARFNVESAGGPSDHGEFRGLPSPGAAAAIGAILAFFTSRHDPGAQITRWLMPDGSRLLAVSVLPASLILIGLLMVSRVPFPHLFHALVAKRHSFAFLASLVVLLGLALVEWQLALLLAVLAYLAAGISIGLMRWVRRNDSQPRGPSGGNGGDRPTVVTADESAAAQRN
jgi:CDP-diacylglycerol--serine O-phosphatidyltransferase